MSERFLRLTPDAVLAAVERAGLEPSGHVTPLVCLENRVFDVRLEDGRHVVAKFYRPGRWSAEAIGEEHRFLADLAEAEIPVCRPLTLPGGGTVGQAEELFYAIWPRTGGRAPDELTDAELATLGRLLARIHNVGATRDAPHRPRVDLHSRLEEPLARLLEGGWLPSGCGRRLERAAREVGRLYAERSRGVPVHRIHGDCHAGNLLRGREGWFFLDFDDCAVGPAVQDVWMLVPGRDAEGERQRRVLVEAYREFRDFDGRWLGLVELLRAMRFVWYAAWVARRIDEPAFRDAFPHFGSGDYWERETRDLEEQLERARGDGAPAGEGPSPVAEGGPPLSNRDFFWDL